MKHSADSHAASDGHSEGAAFPSSSVLSTSLPKHDSVKGALSNDSIGTQPHDLSGTASLAGRGIRRALPIVMGYVPVGFAFGVLAVQNGIPPSGAILMSFLVYAGASQFIAVGLWGMGASGLSIILTTFIVNLRHLLMSASLAPWLSRLPRLHQICLGYEISDEVYALHSTAMQSGLPAVLPEMYGASITAHLGWIFGTMLGVFAGDMLVLDPKYLGLDFALPAMFIALIVPQCRGSLHLLVALVSGLVSVALSLADIGRWNSIFATLFAATLGTVLILYRDRRLNHHQSTRADQENKS